MMIFGPDNTRAGMYHLTVGRGPTHALCGRKRNGAQLMSFFPSELLKPSMNDCRKCWAAGRRLRARRRAA